jgi:uncharacterized protein (DUF2147 family)
MHLQPSQLLRISSFTFPGRWAFLACGLAIMLGVQAWAESATVTGLWLEPAGGTLRVYQCGDKVCARIVGFGPNKGPETDVHNTDARLRRRPLCGLQVGEGFKLKDSQHAEDGHIYDPREGKTYSAVMTAEGDTLKLRGFIGFELFGRTETWKRVQQLQSPCSPR